MVGEGGAATVVLAVDAASGVRVGVGLGAGSVVTLPAESTIRALGGSAVAVSDEAVVRPSMNARKPMLAKSRIAPTPAATFQELLCNGSPSSPSLRASCQHGRYQRRCIAEHDTPTEIRERP